MKGLNQEIELKSLKESPLFFTSVLQEGETALYQAIDNDHEECALTLLKAGCEPNVFMVR